MLDIVRRCAILPFAGNAMARYSQIEWVQLGSTRPQVIPCVTTNSTSLCTGMRFEEACADSAGELPEGSLTRHLVWVVLGNPVRYERSLAGKWESAVIEPGDCTVQPAAIPFTPRWHGPMTSPMVEVSSESFAAVCGGDIGGSDVEIRPSLAAKDPLLAQIVFALRDEAQSGCPSGRLYRETLGAAFALHLLRKYSVFPVAVGGRRGGLPSHRLRVVLDYIQSSLARPISLEDLAAVAGTAVSHFAHAFKQSTGYAPHQYVLKKRIEHAAALLRTPSLTMAEISLCCGFADQSHFAKSFRRLMGTTPRDFRNSFSPRRLPARPPAE